MLANKGIYKELKFILNSNKEFTDKEEENRSKNIISEEAACLILDILSDPTARLYTFGNPFYFKFDESVAIKTGTSTKYRDCWLIAITSACIIGLWVGNFDGSPTFGLSGAVACGPILHDLIRSLPAKKRIWFAKPENIVNVKVCGISGKLATEKCPTTTLEFINSKIINNINYCDYHKEDKIYHYVSGYYASWLFSRRFYIDNDKYRLDSNMYIPKPLYKYMHNKSSITLDESVGSPYKECVDKCVCGSNVISNSEIRVKIVYPHDGDVFISDNYNENIIKLQAFVNNPATKVVWLINNLEIARTSAPYETFYRVYPGVYKIVALVDNNFSDSVVIKVE